MKRKLRPLEELNVLDDFLINAIVSDSTVAVPFCRKILTVLLQRPIGDIQIVSQRSIQGITPESRGVRLDVEILESMSDDDGISSTSLVVPNLYDLEPHLKKSDDYTRHNRYYQAKIDSRYLGIGERNFNRLPNLFVISITNFDPFGYDYMMYTVQNQCSEVPELDYNDGLEFIYFYTGGHRGGNESIRSVLRYLEHSCSENVTDASTEELHRYVSHVKEAPEVQMGYMTWEEYARYIAADWVAEEVEEAKAEIRAEVLSEGRREMVLTIADILEEFGPIPLTVKERLLAEQNFETLRRWCKLAAKAESMDDFVARFDVQE